MLRKVTNAKILENNVGDEGVLAPEFAIGVRGDDPIQLGDDELVVNARDGVAAGIEFVEKIGFRQELEA